MSTGIIAGNIASINLVAATVDFGSVAANTTEEETFSLPGVKVGDFVSVQHDNLEAGLLVGSARVEAADVVTVEVANVTASPIDAGSSTMSVLVIRAEGSTLPTGLSI